MSIIGVTGSRKGLSPEQKDYIHTWFKNGWDELHHGDCVGADAEIHLLAYPFATRIVIHPPDKQDLRAFCNGGKSLILPEKPYLERDQDIVDACEILLAFPNSKREKRRSGTWATIRMARKQNRARIIVFPDGTRTFDN